MASKTTTVTLPSSKKKVEVPVDEDGFVPPDFLWSYLKRNGDAYNDYEKGADIVLPVRLTPREAAAWMADPGEYDIESIDVRGRPQRNVGSRTGESKRIHEQIVVYGMPGEEAKIREELDQDFTLKEQRKMVSDGELIVEARPEKKGIGGTYWPNAKRIELDRDDGVTNYVVVHETVHHLRAVDKDRTGMAAPVTSDRIPYTGTSTSPRVIAETKSKEAECLEESCTTAEQLARQRDAPTDLGYYTKVQIYDAKTHRFRKPTRAEAQKMMEDDRDLFTNGTGKALTGDAAIKSVNDHWAESNIANLRLGSTRAITVAQKVGVVKTPAKSATSKSSETKKTGSGGTKQTALFTRSANSGKKKSSGSSTKSSNKKSGGTKRTILHSRSGASKKKR